MQVFRAVVSVAFASVSLVASAVSQTVTYEVISPFAQAIGISDNGEYVCGGGGPTNGFVWSKSGGLVGGFGFGVEAWAVTDDGGSMVGTFSASPNQAGVWTPGGGTQLLGNVGGAAGCGSDVSHLYGQSNDGTTGVGMSWQGCLVSPMRWTQGAGLTLLAKQDANSSARASSVSGDGLVAVGWDEGTSTGGGFGRRACVWTDDNTQFFPCVTASNPLGFGEVNTVNSDGSIFGGSTQNTAFRWTPGLGLELLPKVTGLTGQYFVNGISEDASVAVGVRLQFPIADAILWSPSTGPIRIVDFLANNGVSVSPFDIRVATGVSADGSTICGWGNVGAWVITISEPEVDVYCTAKASSAGCIAQISTSDLGAQPESGSNDYFVTATDVQELKGGLLFVGLTGPGSLPFNGGTLCVQPPLKRGPIGSSGGSNPTGCNGSFSTLVNDLVVPDGLDAGAGNSGWYQYWYRDPANGMGLLGTALSNAVQLDFN